MLGNIFGVATGGSAFSNQTKFLEELKKRKMRPKNFVTDEINRQYEGEVSVAIPLACPLSKKAMTIPAVFLGCRHIRCFDAATFLWKPASWKCPVCSISFSFDQLVIDAFFTDVLKSLSNIIPSDYIALNKDGTWTRKTTKELKMAHKRPREAEDIIDLTVDDQIMQCPKKPKLEDQNNNSPSEPGPDEISSNVNFQSSLPESHSTYERNSAEADGLRPMIYSDSMAVPNGVVWVAFGFYPWDYVEQRDVSHNYMDSTVG